MRQDFFTVVRILVIYSKFTARRLKNFLWYKLSLGTFDDDVRRFLSLIHGLPCIWGVVLPCIYGFDILCHVILPSSTGL